MKIIDLIAAILLVIGGLNMGLIGLIEFDAIAYVVGGTVAHALLLDLIGLSAIVYLTQLLDLR